MINKRLSCHGGNSGGGLGLEQALILLTELKIQKGEKQTKNSLSKEI